MEKTLERIQKWTPPPSVNCDISLGEATDSQIVVGGARYLFYLEVEESGLKALKQATFLNDIAVVTFTLASEYINHLDQLLLDEEKPISRPKYSRFLVVALCQTPNILVFFHTHTHTHTYIYTYIHTYIHTHIHTYTHTLNTWLRIVTIEWCCLWYIIYVKDCFCSWIESSLSTRYPSTQSFNWVRITHKQKHKLNRKWKRFQN
jgi:hypothetical protein